MTWESELGALFKDLEQQAEGLHLTDRDAEVADRSRSEYAQVGLSSRLHASLGAPVSLALLGAGQLEGTVSRVGRDWFLLESAVGGQEWVVRMGAVARVRGLSMRAVTDDARLVAARLGLRSALRGVADAQARVRIHHVDGTCLDGILARVGEDFVECMSVPDSAASVARAAAHVDVVPFGTLAAVQRL